jgi:hypothetical protein
MVAATLLEQLLKRDSSEKAEAPITASDECGNEG